MEDPRIISALFISLKMAYYNVLININRSLTIRLWSAAHYRECHYDSAHFQKRKVMAELLVGFQGALINCQGSVKEHSKTSSNY